MSWEEPEFEVINMAAEIGAYQDDFGDPPPDPIANQPPDTTDTRTAAPVVEPTQLEV